MKIQKILKVFSLVVVLHSALLVMLVLQPGCNAVSGVDTVAKASPTGPNDSGLWVTNEASRGSSQPKAVYAKNEDLRNKQDFVGSTVAYSDTNANAGFVSLDQKTVETAAVYSEGNEHFEYTVMQGDSLWKIANKNGVSMRKVMEYNGLKETSRIHPGQSLLIPGKAKAAVAFAQLEVPEVVAPAKKATVEPQKVIETPAKQEVVLAQASFAPAIVEAPKHEGDGIYVVSPGDSLYLVAMQNNTTVEAIREMNGLSKNLIKPGQKIRIPGKYTGPVAMPEQAHETASFAVAFNDVPVENVGTDYLMHEVAPGEYPGLIARKYAMDLPDLLALNNISNPRMLKVGAKLKVVNPEAAITRTQIANTTAHENDKAVASNADNAASPVNAEESVSAIDFDNFPVIRVGS